MNVKNYLACKKDYSCKSTTCNCENIKLIKSIVDNLKIVRDELYMKLFSLPGKKINVACYNTQFLIKTKITTTIIYL